VHGRGRNASFKGEERHKRNFQSIWKRSNAVKEKKEKSGSTRKKKKKKREKGTIS